MVYYDTTVAPLANRQRSRSQGCMGVLRRGEAFMLRSLDVLIKGELKYKTDTNDYW